MSLLTSVTSTCVSQIDFLRLRLSFLKLTDICKKYQNVDKKILRQTLNWLHVWKDLTLQHLKNSELHSNLLCFFLTEAAASSGFTWAFFSISIFFAENCCLLQLKMSLIRALRMNRLGCQNNGPKDAKIMDKEYIFSLCATLFTLHKIWPWVLWKRGKDVSIHNIIEKPLPQHRWLIPDSSLVLITGIKRRWQLGKATSDWKTAGVNS